jgi:hypothetical protein
MELLAAITTFAVCAAVCVRILAGAYLMANDALDEGGALLAAKNCAEYFKICGAAGQTAASLGGRGRAVYYDKKWRPCEAAEAEFVSLIEDSDPDGGAALSSCRVYVERMTGETLVSFDVFALRRRAGPSDGR